VQGGNLQPASHPQERDLDAWSFLSRQNPIPIPIPSQLLRGLAYLLQFPILLPSFAARPDCSVPHPSSYVGATNELGMVCMRDVPGTHTHRTRGGADGRRYPHEGGRRARPRPMSIRGDCQSRVVISVLLFLPFFCFNACSVNPSPSPSRRDWRR